MPVRKCKNCKSYKDGACPKKKMNVSINATWCKDYDLNAMVGALVTGDLNENTMLLEIEGEMILRAGRYAIIPIDEYEDLIK
jgi:hypothetical protein